MTKLISKNQLIGIIALMVVLLLDIVAPLGIAIGILYAVSFIYVSKESVATIKRFAALTVFLILLKFAIFWKEADYKSYINRGISVFSIGIIAIFSINRRKLQEKIDNDKKIYFDLLKRKNLKLKTYQESLNLYLLLTVTDINGTITFVNDEYCKASGYLKEELIGQNLGLVRSEEHAEFFYEQMWDTIKRGEIWRGEVKSKAKDGSCFWTDTVILPIKDPDEVITEFFALRLLITEKKELQQEQEENLNAFKLILWKVSHKLRAPVTTCMGFKNLLDARVKEMDELNLRGHEQRQKCTSELEQFSREISEFVYLHSRKKQTHHSC